MKPEPKVTLFHAANLIVTLFSGIEVAHHFAHYGLWASSISGIIALVLTYFLSFYAISYGVLWLWYHSRNIRLKFEVACYLLAALKNERVINEVNLWWEHNK